MSKTVILSTARTPFGKMGGGSRSLDATDLGGTAITEALERAEVAPGQVQGVVYGQVLQAGQGQIPSRQAQIKAGIPKEVPSETDQQGLRLRHARDRARRPGDPRGRPRGRRHRRDGVDVQRPVPAARSPLRLPHGRRQGDRRDDPRRAHQPLHREADDQRGERGRQRARDHPAPTWTASPRARHQLAAQGDRGGQARRGDRLRDGQVAARARTWSRPTRRSGPTRPSRRSPS